MSKTKLSLLATLTFSSWTGARADSPQAWMGEDFIMEEVVVRAEVPSSFYKEEIMVRVPAPPSHYIDEIVTTEAAASEESLVTEERPRVDVTPGAIRPPRFLEKPTEGAPARDMVMTTTADDVRSYAAREVAAGTRRLF